MSPSASAPPAKPRSRPARAAGWRTGLWTSLLTLAAALQLLALWLAAYRPGNLDDKAVHYYSAARLAASPDRVRAVEAAIPAWLNKLPPNRHFRLTNRLHSAANYLVPGLLLRGLCASGPPDSFSVAVKAALALAFALALLALVALTARHPPDLAFALACALAAGLGFSWSTLAPPAAAGMGPLTSVPRGSALLLLPAAWSALARRRWIAAGIALLLIAGWHAGLAALALPIMLLAFGLTAGAATAPLLLRLFAALLPALLAHLLTRAFPEPAPATALWIPIGVFGVILMAGPMLRRNPGLDAAAALGLFLFLLLAADRLATHPPLIDGLARITGNALVRELPARLSGVRHLTALALPLALLAGLLEAALPDRFLDTLKRRAGPPLALIGLVAVLAAGGDAWPRAGRNLALIFHAEEGRTPRPQITAAQLPHLDPRQEARFFLTLGDFLMAPRQ